MNKTKINELLPRAVEILKTTGIVYDGNKICKTYRGQISTFGAAVYSGSLLAAVAFFSDRGGAEADRVKLMKAIYSLITKKEPNGKDALYNYVSENKNCKEEVINAAIALKIAMNVYDLEDKNKEEEK